MYPIRGVDFPQLLTQTTNTNYGSRDLEEGKRERLGEGAKEKGEDQSILITAG
jgi:hypothetical protein